MQPDKHNHHERGAQRNLRPLLERLPGTVCLEGVSALGGILFGASVAVPFWLASELLVGLVRMSAWSVRRTHEPPSGRAVQARLALGRQAAR